MKLISRPDVALIESCAMKQDDADDEFDRDLVARSGTFSVELVSPQVKWRSRPNARFKAHDAVLRPLLAIAEECWLYDKPSPEVFRIARDILDPDKRRYRVSLQGDPIRGRELFWNATGGGRGTIVILVPRPKFRAATIFRGGNGAFVCTNFLTGHTPSAIRFARERVANSNKLAVCLPRNNGIEYMDIHARPEDAIKLFDRACRVGGKL